MVVVVAEEGVAAAVETIKKGRMKPKSRFILDLYCNLSKFLELLLLATALGVIMAMWHICRTS